MPRRGLYATHHAAYPLFRYPLDPLIRAAALRLHRIEALDYFGSAQFPLLAEVTYEPAQKADDEILRVDAQDRIQPEAKLERVDKEMP
jgi:hypothetical protein